jgi:hypothetical protein
LDGDRFRFDPVFLARVTPVDPVRHQVARRVGGGEAVSLERYSKLEPPGRSVQQFGTFEPS